MRTLSSEVAAMLNPVPIMACSWADKEQGKKKVTAGVVCCGQKCLGTRFTGQVDQRGNHFTSASTNGMASQQFLLQYSFAICAAPLEGACRSHVSCVSPTCFHTTPSN